MLFWHLVLNKIKSLVIGLHETLESEQNLQGGVPQN